MLVVGLFTLSLYQNREGVSRESVDFFVGIGNLRRVWYNEGVNVEQQPAIIRSAEVNRTLPTYVHNRPSAGLFFRKETGCVDLG